MYNPADPNCEPMPPDDPTAHRKMHLVDGKKGSKHLHHCGCTQCVENPRWKQYLLVNENGEVRLDKETAIDLALLHSPEYQAALENLYLAALSVSKERFRYDVQFFGGDSLLFTNRGSLRNDSGTVLTNDAALEAQKLFATGGELVAGLANTVTWSLAGADSWKIDSLINVGLTQPLLRGAGKKIVLEQLTQSERDFLAAVRQMVYFRQAYYVKTVTGIQRVSLPSGDVSANVPTLSGGFYGLISEQVQIENQRQNIVGLEDNYNRFQDYFSAGKVDVYQVQQTKQGLLDSQSSLLTRKGSFRTNIETYLRSLGMPPDLEVKIEDPLLEVFQLVSPSLIELREELNQLLITARQKDARFDQTFADELKKICVKSESEINSIVNDLGVLEQKKSERLAGLKALESQLTTEIKQGERVDANIYDQDEFLSRIAKLKEDVRKNTRQLRAIFTLAEHLSKNNPEDENSLVFKPEQYGQDVKDAIETLDWVPLFEADDEGNIKIADQQGFYRTVYHRLMTTLLAELNSLSIFQTRTRLDSITLVPTEITAEEAFGVAKENRLDWMNRRAALVDSWRKIDITANKLKSSLNLQVKGDIGTIDKHGAKFDAGDGQLSVGLKWDAPLTRYNEMVDYRRSQIEYQSARRDYYTYVDSVNADLRSLLRNIRVNQIDFEIQRNAILVATIRVDNAQLSLEKRTIDTSTARNLVEALQSLLSAQNKFLSIWVDYQTQRMRLDLEMGTMQLNDRGHWIDPGPMTTQTYSVGTPQDGPPKNPTNVPSKLTPRFVPDTIPDSMPKLAPPQLLVPEELPPSSQKNVETGKEKVSGNPLRAKRQENPTTPKLVQKPIEPEVKESAKRLALTDAPPPPQTPE